MNWRSARGGSKRALNRGAKRYDMFRDLGKYLSLEERTARKALGQSSGRPRSSSKLALHLLALGLAELSSGRLALTAAGRGVLATMPTFRTPSRLDSPRPGMTAELARAVMVERSLTDRVIVCLECGRVYKALKMHLAAAHGITPDEYRARWALPDDYPMVAPLYSRRRRYLADQMGLRHPARRKTLKRK